MRATHSIASVFGLLGLGSIIVGISFFNLEIKSTVRSEIDVMETLLAKVNSHLSGNPNFLAARIEKPNAWEDFATGNLQAMPTGQRWNLLPGNTNTRVLPVLRDGYMTATDSGKVTTQAYASFDYEKVPSSVRSEISFSNGASGCGAALILTKTMNYTSSDAHIVDDGAVHIVFSDRKIFIGLFKDHDFYVAKTVYYPTPLNLDGTKYVVGYDIVGDIIKIYAPGIDALQFQNARIKDLSGSFLTVESFWTSGECQPRFHAVEAS